VSVRSKERVFVDTTVVIYAFDTSAGEKREKALALLAEFWNTGNGCLSVQVLQEFYLIATQKLARPMPVETVKRIVTALSRWEVHTPTEEDVLSAIEMQKRHRLSFWDAMIITSASKLGCRVLYSEELSDTELIAGVQVVDPFSGGSP
jgi:predicted nucleic acid-binding protein